MSDQQLSTTERAELEQYEAVIERGLKTFLEVGNALLAIRDARLYRTEHATFEDYCENRWNFKRAQAYRLMGAANAVNNLSPNGDIPLPSNEAQVRPLTRLETPELQRQAWQQAVATAPGGKVTAAHVEQVVEDILNEPTLDDPLIAYAYRHYKEGNIARNDVENLASELSKAPEWYRKTAMKWGMFDWQVVKLCVDYAGRDKHYRAVVIEMMVTGRLTIHSKTPYTNFLIDMSSRLAKCDDATLTLFFDIFAIPQRDEATATAPIARDSDYWVKNRAKMLKDIDETINLAKSILKSKRTMFKAKGRDGTKLWLMVSDHKPELLPIGNPLKSTMCFLPGYLVGAYYARFRSINMWVQVKDSDVT